MEFTVCFTTPDWRDALNLESVGGLDILDMTREKFDLPNFPIEAVYKPEGKGLSGYEITIPEENARSSGLFQHRDKVTVVVKGHFLNQYAELNKDGRYTPDNHGGYRAIRLMWTINKNRLLQDWVKAGFPLKWDLEEEEEG
jgi:hypothetical protein